MGVCGFWVWGLGLSGLGVLGFRDFEFRVFRVWRFRPFRGLGLRVVGLPRRELGLQTDYCVLGPCRCLIKAVQGLRFTSYTKVVDRVMQSFRGFVISFARVSTGHMVSHGAFLGAWGFRAKG